MYYNIIITIIITSAVPIAWPLVLMCAAFSRTANQNNFMLNTSLPWVPCKPLTSVRLNERLSRNSRTYGHSTNDITVVYPASMYSDQVNCTYLTAACEFLLLT